ncbi:alcohol acyltransferase 16-like [Ziziphus jujuba]|uniref:Alcohol acyltransferase 16-like n=1 Tax=Ziziphus jujuba TaxID=326968 RepID=A0ABM4AAS6_ZIZJJ|nr:alcohol acyltransferase 16-like [Ziziphus jujuba]
MQYNFALPFDPFDTIGVSYMVNARVAKDIQVPNGYYGNAFAFPMVPSEVGLVCDRLLGYALELVKEIKTQMTLEYIKSVVDLMVIKGQPCYNTDVGSFIVSDMTRIPSISHFSRSKNRGGEEGIVKSSRTSTDSVKPATLPPLSHHI